MINPFQEIVSYEKDNIQDHLTKLNIIKIFEPIFEKYGEDMGLCSKIVKFIVWGFSMESDMLMTMGNTWGGVSKVIFEKAELPEELYDEVAMLQDEAVLSSTERWLQFQNNEYFTQYIHYRDLRRQMLSYSLSNLKKASGEIDINAKMDAAVNSKELLKLMQDAMDTFIQNHPKLRGSVEAFNKATNKSRDSRNVASYAK